MKKFKYPIIEGCPDKYLRENADESYYFRITKNNPPTEEDFIPLYVSNENYAKKRKESCEKKKDNKCLCLMCGLSLFKKKEEAKFMMNRYPRLGRFLFRGYIKMEYGVLKASPNRDNPSHHTWYPFEGTSEMDIFIELINNEE